jgi:hypothetical protein
MVQEVKTIDDTQCFNDFYSIKIESHTRVLNKRLKQNFLHMVFNEYILVLSVTGNLVSKL